MALSYFLLNNCGFFNLIIMSSILYDDLNSEESDDFFDETRIDCRRRGQTTYVPSKLTFFKFKTIIYYHYRQKNRRNKK